MEPKQLPYLYLEWCNPPERWFVRHIKEDQTRETVCNRVGYSTPESARHAIRLKKELNHLPVHLYLLF
jgi:hypothetical protein